MAIDSKRREPQRGSIGAYATPLGSRTGSRAAFPGWRSAAAPRRWPRAIGCDAFGMEDSRAERLFDRHAAGRSSIGLV